MVTMDTELEGLRKILSTRVMIFCHPSADPDAVCSAYALKGLSEALGSAKASIVLTGGASRVARRVIQALEIQAVEEAAVDEAEALIVVDTSSIAQLEGWGELMASSGKPIVLIDHHAPRPEALRSASLHIVDEGSTSTCEIVYRLYREMGVRPPPRVARALLAGIAYDSGHFSIGRPGTFRAVSELLEIDDALQDVLALLASEMDRSERIARLKAAQRSELHKVGGWIAAVSHVSSFQASASRALIMLGADVAIVAGGRGEDVKVSLRSTERFRRGTMIHLGRDVAIPLGEELGGVGGGHSTSAGVKSRGDAQAILRRALELLSARVRMGHQGPSSEMGAGPA
jgi:nanoRNase/pAp phosphatase (c-di-AMP/oligoRNAs hydrolase)